MMSLPSAGDTGRYAYYSDMMLRGRCGGDAGRSGVKTG